MRANRRGFGRHPEGGFAAKHAVKCYAGFHDDPVIPVYGTFG